MKIPSTRLLLCGLLCLAGAVTPANGTDTRYLPDKPGFWQAQRAIGEHGSGITPAEVAQIKANLERIEAVLKTTHIGANPVGFYYLPSPMWVSQGRNTPILQGLGIFPLTFMEMMQQGKWVLDMHGETSPAHYYINQLSDIERVSKTVFEEKLPNGKVRVLFTLPERKGLMGGFPVYGDTAFIVRPGREMAIPVTMRQALQAAMPVYQEARDAADREVTSRKQRQKEFDAEGYQKRELEGFEKQWGYLKATDRKDYEERKRQWMGPVLRQVKEIEDAAVTPVRGDKRSEWYFLQVDAYANAQQRLANLSPQEASAPACFEEADLSKPYVTRGEVHRAPAGPKCLPLLKTNPDYYDRTLPRTSVQLVTVTGISCVVFKGGRWTSPRTKLSEGGCAVHGQMWQELNWQSLADLLVK